MKSPLLSYAGLLVALVVGSLLGACSRDAGARVYLAPSPGDLSQVVGLTESNRFDLEVAGRDAFVYHASKSGASELSAQGVSYCQFFFEGGPVEARITAREDVLEWKAAPVDAKNILSQGPREFRLRFDAPAKIRVYARFAGDVWHDFIVSAEAPEVGAPKQGDAGVLWLGPGTHKFGRAWDPFVNGIKTVYLAPGAVVEATIKTRDKRDISILGRGLFMQAFTQHAKRLVGGRGWFSGYMGMYFRSCTNVVVDGVGILCPPSFHLEVADCEKVQLRNLKLCGFGDSNNDGIHVYSRHVVVDDCFIAGNDDRICLNGLFDNDLPSDVAEKLELGERMTDTAVEDVRIRKCVFWGLRNGGDIMITWNAGKPTRDIIIEDCDSIAQTNKAFVTAMHAGSGTIGDILVRDCRVHHPHFVYLSIKEKDLFWGHGGGRISDLTFENIRISAKPADVGRHIEGLSATSDIGRVVFRNITADGVALTRLEDTGIRKNEFVGEVVFEQNTAK